MPDLRIVTALPLSLRPAYEALLASAGLRDEGDADCTALLSSDGGALLACGSVSGRVLKQIAVAPWAEGDGACARIVTALLEESARRGVAHPFLYTKPKNARLFRSLGFFPVAETADILMMEHRRGGVERYIASLPAYDGSENPSYYDEGCCWKISGGHVDSVRIRYSKFSRVYFAGETIWSSGCISWNYYWKSVYCGLVQTICNLSNGIPCSCEKVF